MVRTGESTNWVRTGFRNRLKETLMSNLGRLETKNATPERSIRVENELEAHR